MDSDRSGSPSLLRAGLAAEFALFKKPKVLLAALALIFVPSLYVLIYVSSVWDPYGKLHQLPAALVNQDTAFSMTGREVNLGAQIVATLEATKPFGFVRFETPEAARAAVRAGDVFFALMIPPHFSEQATTARHPAQLNLYLSEGANYTAAVFSQRFGAELAHTLNEKIGRERWALLIGDPNQPTGTTTLRTGLTALRAGGEQLAQGSEKVRDGTHRLQAGLGQAADGAAKLATGSDQLAEGSALLTDGMRQVKAAVTTMRTKLPGDNQLHELSEGSAALTRGSGELSEGLVQLQAGSQRLAAGGAQLQEGAAKVPIFGGKLAAGTGQLRAGIGELGSGIDRAAAGGSELKNGMQRLDAGVQPLARGLVELNAGLGTLDTKLPTTDQLALFYRSMNQLRDGNHTLDHGLNELKSGAAQLTQGSDELAQGAAKLAAGMNEASSRFEAGFAGSQAALLAAPVTTAVEIVAPVPHNGPAFAPYFCALSLWVGAVMMSFVFHLRRLPDFLRDAARPTRWLVKATPLLALGFLQATVVIGALALILGIHFDHPGLVWLVAVIGSIAFVSAVLALLSILGDAGRLLAVILLIFQLAASGGIYPVELSSTFYQKVHGYLPFTFLLRSLRATMFSAFDGHWIPAVGMLGGFALIAVVTGVLLARWKFVAAHTHGPAVEF